MDCMDEDKEGLDDLAAAERFAKLLEETLAVVRFSPGQQVTARIIRISGDRIALDLGENCEGYIDRKQLEDAEGKPSEFVGRFLVKS
jgi:ribosomal protein S1